VATHHDAAREAASLATLFTASIQASPRGAAPAPTQAPVEARPAA